MFRRFRGTVALVLAAAAAPALAAPPAPCLSDAEAQSVALVAMPEIIRQTGQICAAALPPSALIRQTGGPFIAKYQAEADRAWPAARAALARIGGPDVTPLLQSDFTRPLLTSLLAPALVGTVEPRDCPEIDHMVTLLQPLPPQNTAGLIVAGLQMAREKQAEYGSDDSNRLDLPICPATRR